MSEDRDVGPQPDKAQKTSTETRKNKGGRPKGSRSKKNIMIEQMGTDLENGSVREIVFAVFDIMGGLAGLLRWAEKNPDKFYQNVWLRMGPRSQGSKAGRPPTAPRRDAPTKTGDVQIEDFSDDGA